MFIFRKKAPAKPAPVTAEHIVAVVTEKINDALRMHLTWDKRRMDVDHGDPDALRLRRAYGDFSRNEFNAAFTLWQLAKESGFAHMIEVDEDLVRIFSCIVRPLEPRAAA